MQSEREGEGQDFWRGICDLPSCMQTLLAACTFLTTRQTKQKTQTWWKLKFINSAVHRYLSEAIKAQQYFLPPFFQLISFYLCSVLALSISLCNILLETISVLEAESQKLLRFNLKQCFVRKRETLKGAEWTPELDIRSWICWIIMYKKSFLSRPIK